MAPLEVQRAPLSLQDLFIKRAFDVVLASFGLVALSPLLLFTAIAIKLESPGPIIFRQRRRGFSGREFAIFKFRCMSVQEDGPCIQQAKRGDERVTRIGRLLRATSIDELPQLLNVLPVTCRSSDRVRMLIAHDDEYSNSIDNYAFRHHVKPGITGWAQMHGFRGETADVTAMKNRIQLDLWYINNWNFWLDFRIMGRTFIELLRSPTPINLRDPSQVLVIVGTKDSLSRRRQLNAPRLCHNFGGLPSRAAASKIKNYKAPSKSFLDSDVASR